MSQTTEALIKRVQDAEYPEEALGRLTPGQQARVIFAMYIRQLGFALKTDPSIGVNLSGALEDQLEQTVDRMFRPHIHKIHHEANRDFRTAQDEIERLGARVAALEAALRKIADQTISEDHDDDQREHADYIHGYDMCIKVARAAMEGKDG